MFQSGIGTWIHSELFETQFSGKTGISVCRQSVCQSLEHSLIHF